MPDWPAGRQTLGSAASIHSGGFEAQLFDPMRLNANSFAAATVTQNRITYMPFIVERTVTAYQMAWENGATVDGNIDAGILNEAGTLLVSTGSTAQSGASVVQVANITDTVLPPGTYFMAIVSDSATATLMTSGIITQVCRAAAGMQWEAAFPIPASATMSTIAGGAARALAVLLRPEA